ncbi:unnamed protein product [Arabidopsis arenosa]|uniref:Uncharacterized protein n=1 Tax=Arabidopsis arenosa TaxID=38785 RepID=A0A8S1ZDD5_ARAAE|nr:unnamed protein product [Arabidopsis arenosa]
MNIRSAGFFISRATCHDRRWEIKANRRCISLESESNR